MSQVSILDVEKAARFIIFEHNRNNIPVCGRRVHNILYFFQVIAHREKLPVRLSENPEAWSRGPIYPSLVYLCGVDDQIALSTPNQETLDGQDWIKRSLTNTVISVAKENDLNLSFVCREKHYQKARTGLGPFDETIPEIPF